MFLQKGNKTNNIWIYDARTDIDDVTKASRPLSYEKHFSEFVNCYGESAEGLSPRFETDRFKKYSLSQIEERGYDLLFTNKFDPEPLENPVYYVDKLIENFEQQIKDLYRLKELL
ncbi:N-6 DNA methylase [Spirosoma endbachense]|uniref:N-6 DNA methylase n=1 Tax=Spirosoma endbachense TaxID=2666025 RepID=A0A6P1W8L9_9BACT|nr:N-6 DNA methylase [Spirosoma endbachense]